MLWQYELSKKGGGSNVRYDRMEPVLQQMSLVFPPTKNAVSIRVSVAGFILKVTLDQKCLWVFSSRFTAYSLAGKRTRIYRYSYEPLTVKEIEEICDRILKKCAYQRVEFDGGCRFKVKPNAKDLSKLFIKDIRGGGYYSSELVASGRLEIIEFSLDLEQDKSQESAGTERQPRRKWNYVYRPLRAPGNKYYSAYNPGFKDAGKDVYFDPAKITPGYDNMAMSNPVALKKATISALANRPKLFPILEKQGRLVKVR